MKLIIFAGGAGTRLWPLSRENCPKQFEKEIFGRSTLELALARVLPQFGAENIFIQTLEQYADLTREQAGEIPPENIIIEPARRNLAAAVCFSLVELERRGFGGTVGLLWADHLVENVSEFIESLKTAEKLIEENQNRFVFLGEKPRFANNNLGWINIGVPAGRIGEREYYSFSGWKYKPSISECEMMYQSGDYLWNPGYFITSLGFLLEQYRSFAPDIYDAVIKGNYEQARIAHFDKAIIEKIDHSSAIVLKTEMGWSDPGTLYGLKEALASEENDNITHGRVIAFDTEDSLIYNFEEGDKGNNKIVAAVGLKGMVVINTPDALLVVPKDEVVKISELIKKMRAEGMEEYL